MTEIQEVQGAVEPPSLKLKMPKKMKHMSQPKLRKFLSKFDTQKIKFVKPKFDSDLFVTRSQQYGKYQDKSGNFVRNACHS